MNKQQLAAKIWESANKMRSKIEAHEYKDYILGFIFYKYLSEAEVTFAKNNDFTEADLRDLTEDEEDTVNFVKESCGYFISYDNLFQTWIAKGADFQISDVRVALSAFDRNINKAHKLVFDGIFETLQTGLSKLGTDATSQTKAARDLIYLIKDIPMNGRQDYDVLGFIYEYLISNFAANAGKKAGEFYTPHEVSQLMSEIIASHLQGRDEIEIYDPTSGSGSLLINIGNAVARRNGNHDAIIYYAQELKENTYNLTRMNLIMRGIKPDNIKTRNGDTLEDDWPYFDDANKEETYEPLFVDAVVSNPPYSQHWDPEGKDSDPRFAFGLAPKSKADYAFLLHDLYHLKSSGIMTIVLPHGVLFRGGEEGAIRKQLLEHKHIQAVIGLPANIFFGTGIPTIIMVLRKDRPTSDVLIIDASKHFIKEGKNNKLQSSDIKRIVDVVCACKTVPGFSRLVPLEEIRANDYNLNIPRYVDSSEPAETWDIYASMFGGVPKAEIDALEKYWAAFPQLKAEIFADNGTTCATVKVEDVAATVKNNAQVQAFTQDFARALEPFKLELESTLLAHPDKVDPLSEEALLAEKIKAVTDKFALVDEYDAFQQLSNAWANITIDLEVIQSEGVQAVRKVDPNMVTKKKGAKDIEVQDGWCGRVLPFELVQQTLLTCELQNINQREQRMGDIDAEIAELLDNLDEEEKQDECVSEDGTSFMAAAVKRRIKGLKKVDATPFELTLMKVDALNTEQKSLKSQVKTMRLSLDEQAKAAIENLTDDECKQLLSAKWITPLCDSLEELPQAVVADLTANLQKLCSKYNSTYASISEEIAQSEASLSNMIDQLVGNEYDMAGLAEFKSLLGGK